MTDNRVIGTMLLVLSIGCGSDPMDSGSIESKDLLGRCSGAFTCKLAGASDRTANLTRVGTECRLGSAVILDPTGKVYTSEAKDEVGLTWSGDTTAFRICDASDCLECAPNGAASPAATSGGKCTGSPRSCSSLSAGSCVLDGCSFSGTVQWDGSIAYECEGSARSCSAYSTQTGCEGQSGCAWQ